MNQLQMKQDELAAKQKALHELISSKPDMDFTDEEVKDIEGKNDELARIGEKVDELKRLAAIAESVKGGADDIHRPASPAGGEKDAPNPEQTKSVGELFVASAGYQNARKNGSWQFGAQVPANVKTLMTEATGFAPQAIRTGQVILSPQQMPKIVDIVPSVTTDMTAVVYMRETTFTNAAAETAEGGQYGEAALAYSEESSPVRKIAVFIPVTDEQLADVKGMQDRLNNRLTLMLRQRIDLQVVAGDGTGSNLTGLINQAGIQTQPRGVDPQPDALYKAIVLGQNVGFCDPDGILMNPFDWQTIRLMRSADGGYLFGSPADKDVARLWGLPIVTSTFIPQHTSVVADFAQFTEIAYRENLEFEVSNSHQDYFAKGQLAIRAQLRAAFTVLRPSAVVAVTGM